LTESPYSSISFLIKSYAFLLLMTSNAMEFTSMALTKDHIALSLQSRLGLSRSESSRYLDSLLSLLKRSLAGGDCVLITGFGKFSVREKATRRERNPATGEDMNLAPRRVGALPNAYVLS
jgi:integration host factor subunit alpha